VPQASDLARTFDRLFVAAAGDRLKEAGFRRRSGPRHWRRASDGRVDFVDVHRQSSTFPQVGHFVVNAAIHIAAVERYLWPEVVDLDAVKSGAPLWLRGETTVELHDESDEAEVHARLEAVLDVVLSAFESIDVTTPDGLLDAVRRWQPGNEPLAHAANGDLAAAKRALIDGASRPGRFDSPDQFPHPYAARVAEVLGVGPATLPSRPAGGFVSWGAVRDRLRELDGLASTRVSPRHDRLHIDVLRPGDEDLARIRAVTTELGIDEGELEINALPLSLPETARLAARLKPELLARERARPELVAVVRSVSASQLMVEVVDLDDETEAYLRGVVPDAVLLLVPPFRGRRIAELEKAERLASSA
jgi:hypothetical protein